jgi:hypothetical protein
MLDRQVAGFGVIGGQFQAEEGDGGKIAFVGRGRKWFMTQG